MLNAIPPLEMQELSPRTGRDMTGQDILKIIEGNYKPVFSFLGWKFRRPYDSAVIKNVKKFLRNHLETPLSDLDFFAALMVTFQPIFARDKVDSVPHYDGRLFSKSVDQSKNINTRSVWNSILEKAGINIESQGFIDTCNSTHYELSDCDLNFWKFVLRENNVGAKENILIFNHWNQVLCSVFKSKESQYYKLIKNKTFQSENQHFSNYLNEERCNKLKKFSKISERDRVHYGRCPDNVNMVRSFRPLMENIFLNKTLTPQEIDKCIDVAFIVADFGQELKETDSSSSLYGKDDGKLINDLFANNRQVIKTFDLEAWNQQTILQEKAQHISDSVQFKKEKLKTIQQSLAVFIDNAKKKVLELIASRLAPKAKNNPISPEQQAAPKEIANSSLRNNPASTFPPVKKQKRERDEIEAITQEGLPRAVAPSNI